MAASPDIARIAHDPAWLAHRYDPGHDAFHLLRLPRADHARLTFLNEELVPADAARVVVRRGELLAARPPAAPLHLVLHSAFCCSTLLVRACDRPGRAMGLSEPLVLHDLVGWRRRGGDPARVGTVLDGALRLLARPFGPGEAVVAKPSNVANGLAEAMLRLRPDMRALLLHAPLAGFLASVAKKGMWGRLWVRELWVGLIGEGAAQRLGFTDEQLLMLTDLQVAAAGWLAQQALFADLAARFPDRVRTLASDRLLADSAAAVAALFAHYRIALAPTEAAAIAAGPAFTRHSKTGDAFGPAARAAEQADMTQVHAEELEKVAAWAATLAAAAGVPLTLPAPLLA